MVSCARAAPAPSVLIASPAASAAADAQVPNAFTAVPFVVFVETLRPRNSCATYLGSRRRATVSWGGSCLSRRRRRHESGAAGTAEQVSGWIDWRKLIYPILAFGLV
ncbi:hypothetical protein GCM10007890_65880 [Methylobacterium tardum]|uniref:Uncharacterized protein n=1 Tax=Methylobacterium tardum TaxID=374432 RepID=A0AA37TJY6_9HYPH|nr:hypothetical protein GCM10007890_65880 [Methylobacterium tardum]